MPQIYRCKITPPQINWEHFSEVIKLRDRSVNGGEQRERNKRILVQEKQTNVSKERYETSK